MSYPVDKQTDKQTKSQTNITENNTTLTMLSCVGGNNTSG